MLASCRQGDSTSDAPEARSPARQPASPVAPGPYAVSPEALDRYIGFQEQSLGLHAETVRELTALEKRDAGAGPEAAALVRRQGEAMMALRQNTGLTDRDVRELERIVGDVISRRALAATAEEASALSDLENLAARLSEKDREALEASLASVREQQRAFEALTEERKRYGDANVDAVLSRERELTRLWQRTIATFAGAEAPGDAGTPGRSRR